MNTGCQAHSAVLWFNGGWKALLTTPWVVVWVSQKLGAKQKIVEKSWNKRMYMRKYITSISPVAILYLIWSFDLYIYTHIYGHVALRFQYMRVLDASFLVRRFTKWSETKGTEGKKQSNIILVSTPLPTKALTHNTRMSTPSHHPLISQPQNSNFHHLREVLQKDGFHSACIVPG